jgi:hypothetical protein
MNTHLTRRKALAALGGSLVLPAISPAARAAGSPVLVELFTSQGCSSCPPADAILGDLRKSADVIAVTYNVDYWDYLGWHDTLAKPEYSKRQFDYGKSRGDMQVYTPQMVMNGHYHAVGSDRSAVTGMISDCHEESLPVSPRLDVANKEISVTLPAFALGGEATLWLLAITPKVVQKIERGENAGKSVTYYNVVRNMVPAALWKGEAYHGSWMRDAVMPSGCTGCVVVLQRDKTGPVIGLASA